MDGVVTLAMDMVVTLATVWDTQDTVSSESFHFAVDSRLIEITKLTPFRLACVYFRSFFVGYGYPGYGYGYGYGYGGGFIGE